MIENDEFESLVAELNLLLDRWLRGLVSTPSVHESAEQMEARFAAGDFSGEGFHGVVGEALEQLSVLNHQWILPEDVPAFRQFLELGRVDSVQAWDCWTKYWDTVDLADREARLKGDPYYIV